MRTPPVKKAPRATVKDFCQRVTTNPRATEESGTFHDPQILAVQNSRCHQGMKSRGIQQNFEPPAEVTQDCTFAGSLVVLTHLF